MARALRRDQPDGAFHVAVRAVAGAPYDVDDDDGRAFLVLLARVVVRFGWEMNALCPMGNHYRLVLEALRADLAAGMHRLNGVYAQGFDERHGRRGHLFGDRVVSRVAGGDRHLRTVCRHVAGNPVRAGPWQRRPTGPGATAATASPRRRRAAPSAAQLS